MHPYDLAKRHNGYWGEHPDFPVVDWQYEVANDGTREGYWEWVIEQMGAAEED